MKTLDIQIGERSYRLECDDDDEASTRAAMDMFRAELDAMSIDIEQIGAARAFLIVGARLCDTIIAMRKSVESLKDENRRHADQFRDLEARQEAQQRTADDLQKMAELTESLTSRVEGLAKL